MGMSTHVKGFKPPDEKWKQMKAVFDNCVALKIGVPKEVMAYFEGDEPRNDDPGVRVNEDKLLASGAIRRWQNEHHSCQGYEIIVDNIPSDVKVIRVYNNW